jgi:hypothetical protein
VPRYPRGADTVGAAVVDSVAVLVHETLPDIADRLENSLSLDQKSPKLVCVGVLLSLIDSVSTSVNRLFQRLVVARTGWTILSCSRSSAFERV